VSRRRKPFRRPWESAAHAVACIEALPIEHQAILGRVVWWDWWSGITVANRITNFDDWLAERAPTEEPPKEGLIESMMALGYSEKSAQKRFKASTGYYKKQHDTTTLLPT
jgi:hypothetical protein